MASARARLTRDSLIARAKTFYVGRGWKSPAWGQEEEKIASRLARRPDLICRCNGMLHLVFVSAKATPAAFNLHKQVLFDVESLRAFVHIVVVLEGSASSTIQKKFKEMGIGVLLIRQDGDPYYVVLPRLTCFKPPLGLKRVPAGLRAEVKDVLRIIAEDDVGVGVMDLSQILEKVLDRKVPAGKGKSLGKKIELAKNAGLLTTLTRGAAKRVNNPRIKRAHARTHQQRRTHIVLRAQEIVDDCLALLFSVSD